MRAVFSAFLRDRQGHIGIEYGMILALMTLLLVTAVTGMGLSVENRFLPLEKAIKAPKA